MTFFADYKVYFPDLISQIGFRQNLLILILKTGTFITLANTNQQINGCRQIFWVNRFICLRPLFYMFLLVSRIWYIFCLIHASSLEKRSAVLSFDLTSGYSEADENMSKPSRQAGENLMSGSSNAILIGWGIICASGQNF